jgi:transposase
VAKVPIRPEMQEALTTAAIDATPGEAPLPQEIPQQFRRLVDEIGAAADNPFMVVEALSR